VALEKSYDSKKIAEILSVSERAVRDLLLKGEIRGWKLGNKWRVSEGVLKSFIDARSKNTQQHC
jgi:excisionase family DNA binding protein